MNDEDESTEHNVGYWHPLGVGGTGGAVSNLSSRRNNASVKNRSDSRPTRAGGDGIYATVKHEMPDKKTLEIAHLGRDAASRTPLNHLHPKTKFIFRFLQRNPVDEFPRSSLFVSPVISVPAV